MCAIQHNLEVDVQEQKRWNIDDDGDSDDGDDLLGLNNVS